MNESAMECPSAWASVLCATDASSSMLVAALVFTTMILLVLLLNTYNFFHHMMLFAESCFVGVPMLAVETTEAETKDDGITTKPCESIKIFDPKNPGFVQCYDPSTKQHLGQVVAMSKEDVHRCCELAAEAQKAWVKTTYAQRRLVLRTIQKYIVSHVDEICRVCARDSGKSKVDALLGEVMTTCEKIRTILAHGELWLQPSYRPTGPMMLHKKAYVEYVPFGVLGVIAPWNYPFHNMLNHIISGIFAGNGIVGKVSEHTSWSSQYFSRIVQGALELHGHDPNLVQTVTGFGNAGAALVEDPLVQKIIFTGSPGVGRKVMTGAAPHLKPVILELGGKDPMIFCNDVSLPSILPWAMRGCFQNCGQNCCGVERVLVYESIHDDFVKAITPKVKGLVQGVPLATCGASGNVDCGAMVMEEQMSIIQELVDDAVAKGAMVRCGGKRNDKLNGLFYEPTVLTGVTLDMRISQEEVFGPVMCIMKVPNDDDDECVRIADACPFGLGASVYSGNQSRATKIGMQINSGMLNINDFGVNYLVQSIPFGGTKESGFDRFAGPEGLRGCCLERSIVVDRIPGVKTTIPPPIDYPIEQSKGLGFGNALLQLFYNESLLAKIKGILGLIKNS